jgi:hypothetical protein
MSPGAAVEERGFGEIRRLCLSGLDETTLLRRVIARLRHVVPIDTYWAPRIDPLSGLHTGMLTEGTSDSAKHIRNAFENIGVRSRQALVKRLYLNTIFP